MTLKLAYENFWKEYPRLVEVLFSPITEDDGFSEIEIAAAEERLSVKLPALLREFYKRAGKHESNRIHNRLIPPEKLKVVDGKYLAFYTENQDVYLNYWDIEQEGENPAVYVQYDGFDVSEEAKDMSSFFGIMLAQQGALGLDYEYAAGDGSATREVFDQFTEGWICIETENYIGAIKEGAALYYILPDEPGEEGGIWTNCESLEDALRINEYLGTVYSLEEDME